MSAVTAPATAISTEILTRPGSAQAHSQRRRVQGNEQARKPLKPVRNKFLGAAKFSWRGPRSLRRIHAVDIEIDTQASSQRGEILVHGPKACVARE
jgi:hypothetical protein